MFTKNELEAYLRKQWGERGCTLADDQRMGIAVSELVEYSVQRNAKLDVPYVDLWVAILDELISWQISLVTIFYAERRETILTNFDKSVTMLLMKIIGDSTAIRHLILLGFDTSARTLLRSTAEYMELLVAILSEPRLAEEFVNTDTPEGADKFWKTHLGYGGIRKRMLAAWQEFFSKEDSRETAEWFANWGNSSNKILSSMIHPSLAGGLFTAIPFKAKYDDENWLGVWGDKSEGSVDTVFIYASFMFPVLLLHHEFPFSGFDACMGNGGLKYDESNEMHKHVKIGRDILASLVLSLCKDTNLPHVFPDIDMSIWERGTPEVRKR